ncbi:MAG: secretin N-terminal domain-containing protein, partial [Planctomycetota bacterium]
MLLIIAISPKGDRAWGYSRKLAKWTTIEFKAPAGRLVLLGSQDVGCLYSEPLGKGKYVWGYSATTGKWGTLASPTGFTTTPVLEDEIIVVENGDQLQIFSDQTGEWSVPPKPDDDVVKAQTFPAKPRGANPGMVMGMGGPAGPGMGAGMGGMAAGMPTAGEIEMGGGRLPGMPGNPMGLANNIHTTVKIYELKHADATVAAELAQQLIGTTPGAAIVADKRTNSVIINGTNELHGQAKTLLNHLDANSSPTGPGFLYIPADPVAETENKAIENVPELKAEFEAQERRAIELAERIHHSTAPAVELKAKLRTAVSQAFQLRQQLHQAELALGGVANRAVVD